MAWSRIGRRIGAGLALALLAGCGGPLRHNSAENEFTAWANHVEREDANGQAIPDFEEPANIMEGALPANNEAAATADGNQLSAPAAVRHREHLPHSRRHSAR